MGGKRRTIQDYYDLAKLRGFEWDEKDFPSSTNKRTTWKCSKKHTWQTSFNNIRNGTGCPHCSGKARKTEHDYHSLAESRGFFWIGKEIPETTKEYTLWRCNTCGYEWRNAYSRINSGRGCRGCAVDDMRKKECDYNPENLNGILWVGEKLPRNCFEITEWQCITCDYKWRTSYANIRDRDAGCPRCSGKDTKTKEDYINLANESGLKWISIVLPKDTSTNTEWMCKNGHIFNMRYQCVRRGQKCPICSLVINGRKVSRAQLKLAEMLSIPRDDINHFISTYCADMVVKDKKIVIEYDGWYWHGGKQDKDAEINEFLLQRGWNVIRVKGSSELPDKEEMMMAISNVAEKRYIEIILSDWGIGDFQRI